jgi:23S rRNA pseudouridine1911/1915/1917 synthase
VKETIPAALAGERIDRAVALLTGLPRSEVAALVEAGAVRVGGAVVGTRSRKVAEGDVLEVDVPERVEAVVEADASVEVPVVYADDDVIVVDKPPGLVVHPGSGNASGTLVNGLLARFGDLAGTGDPTRPGVVHRLDKGTSGLLVVARSERAYESLVAQLQARSVSRVYLALVAGVVEAPGGLIDAPIGRGESDPTRMTVSAKGKEARTRYEVMQRFTDPIPCTLLECRLETGRTHQIRVHLGAIGHPVIGDARYGGVRAGLVCPRPFLHAHRLEFDHPASGQRMSWSSPLPPDLDEIRGRLS